MTYTNRKGQTYHLHQGVTKKRNPRYWVSQNPPDVPVAALREIFTSFPAAATFESQLEETIRYQSDLRFVLCDPEERTFEVWRYRYLGSVDDWIAISPPEPLAPLVEEILPKLETEAFYTLF